MINFRSQFSSVYSHFDNHKGVFNLPYLPWMINSNHSSFPDRPAYNFDELLNNKKISKSHLISVICSDKKMTSSQIKRLKFVKYLKKEFGDQLHWFGNGINTIKYKYEGIFPYKYHIVLENQSEKNVITEKLYDSFLGQSYPIYWGAPNIYEYFCEKSLDNIEIDNFKSSLEKIKKIIDSNKYENNFEHIIGAKNKVLKEFNLINRILDVISLSQKKNNKIEKENIKIFPLNIFNLYEKVDLFYQLKKM